MNSDEQAEIAKTVRLLVECAELNGLGHDLLMKGCVTIINAFIENNRSEMFNDLKAKIIRLFIDSFKEAHPDEWIGDWVK